MQNIYSSDEEVCITMSKKWLEIFIIKFGLMVVESDSSTGKLLEFEEIMKHKFENKP
jgi:hypothetical protein